MAGQSGHARNCQAILLNAWPPLPHYGKTATSRLCGMSRDSSGWHFGTAPPSRSCWRSRRLRLSSVSSQLGSSQNSTRSRRQPRPRPVWLSVRIDDDLLQLAWACPSMMCLCICLC
jgi:hypothetical protein